MRKLIILENISEESRKLLDVKILEKYPVEYIVRAAQQANIDKIYVSSLEGLKCNESIKDKVEFLTANNCQGIIDNLLNNLNDEDQVLALKANTPLINKEALEELFNEYEKSGDEISLPNISRKDLQNGEKTAAMVLSAKLLRQALTEDETCIFHLNEVVNKAVLNGFRVGPIKTEKKGVFDRIDNNKSYAKISKELRKRINKFHMENGVIIENPSNTYIDIDVSIGENTFIEAGVRLVGNTTIGKNCHIGFNTKIIDSQIYDNVNIDSSYIEKSIVEGYTSIGPYARLRPNAHLKEHVHIGNFVEVKNSTLGEGTKAGHLTYVGDADLGKDINLGCGVVFVNYDGKFKHRSTIEDGAFIGSNVNIVAPVHVKKDGFIAAGSTITSDVEEGVLVLERAERKDIEGYVAKKRERDALKAKGLGK